MDFEFEIMEGKHFETSKFVEIQIVLNNVCYLIVGPTQQEL